MNGGMVAFRINISPNTQMKSGISPIFTNKSVANALIRLSLIGNIRLKPTIIWLDNYIPPSPNNIAFS